MHYEYEKRSPKRATSAHFRFRRSPESPTLFDSLDKLDAQHVVSTGAHVAPELSELRIAVPSFSAFLSAHHRRNESRKLDTSDVPAMVSVSDKILHLLADGEFHLVTEIRDVAGVLSYDRRLRELRNLVADVNGTTYYVHIDARRSAPDSRTFEYRAHIETFPQAHQ